MIINGFHESNPVGQVIDGTDNLFYKRDIPIATGHKKQEATGPVPQDRFQTNISTPKGFNTEACGTLRGEVER